MEKVMSSAEYLATKAVQAEDWFIELVQEEINCSKSEAERIMSVYLKNKIMKIDYPMGKMKLKHGAFWEPDVLKRALEMANQQS